MKRLPLLLLIPILCAAQLPEEDLQILDVYNQYYFAVTAAELCGGAEFADDKEKKKFESNFKKARIEASKALKRSKPLFTDYDIVKNVQAMDAHSKATLTRAHEKDGCKNDLLRAALKWHANFRKMPPLPKRACGAPVNLLHY